MKTIELDRMTIVLIDELMNIDNIYRRKEKNWSESECEGDYKRVGFMYYGKNDKCAVQLWFDKITGKKRWWFGFYFENEQQRNAFAKQVGIRTNFVFDNKVDTFPNKWLMEPVKEQWKNDNGCYLGIYSKRNHELKAIQQIVKIGQKIKGNYKAALSTANMGGESPEHEEFKKWLSKHPQEIGLNAKDCEMEHEFKCGDRVDLLFKIDNTNDAVVEVEIDNVLPGVFQAIKYRALRCVERGIPLDDTRVKAIVVSKVKSNSSSLCKKYNCSHVVIKKL